MTTAPDCDPDSLRQRGWRQGCQLMLDLSLDHVYLVGRKPVAKRDVHGMWIVVDQDCDLAWKALVGTSYLVELKPVYLDDPPSDWGIRNSKFLLDRAGAHLHADSPSVRVTPEVFDVAEHITCVCVDSGRRLKTWLGLRYDRPAVPEEYSALANALADRIKVKKHRSEGERVRDVLATFQTDGDGTVKYEIVAVLPHQTATPDLIRNTRQWLAEVALEVPDTLGQASDINAYPDDGVSLAYVEASFALSVSTLSWPARKPGPVGEV